MQENINLNNPIAPEEAYTAVSKSTITAELIEVINDDEFWLPHNDFMVKQVSRKLYLQDPFLKKLSEKYDFVMGIIRMNPYHCYNWHTDYTRKVGLNMILSNSPSHCLFSNVSDQNRPFIELNYAPDTYYLFNTDKPHTVINFGEYRYMLTLEVVKSDRAATYTNMLDDIKTIIKETNG